MILTEAEWLIMNALWDKHPARVMQKLKLYLVVAAMLGTLAGAEPARAEDAPESDTVPPKASGIVKDQTGAPVAGAQVAALPISNQYVLTDAQGKFEIGLTEKWVREGRDLYLMARHQQRNLAVVVDVSHETKAVEMKLEPAFTLAGTVTSPDDKPISGARVGLDMNGAGTPIGPTETDGNGRYEFKALPIKQEYGISVRDDGYGPAMGTTGIINTTKDVVEVEQIILKPANMSVSGVVMDVESTPVANAKVSIQGEGQPGRKTKTDAEGKFTLEGICSGTITLFTSINGRFQGSTFKVQAGEKDAKIIVFQEREETPFEVLSTPPDPQEQGLRYHWARTGWGLVDGKSVRVIELSAEKPANVKLPKFKNTDVLFGRWVSPLTKNGFLWIALERTYKYGPHDRMIIDANGNGHLDDETVVAAHTTWQQYRAYFGPVKVVFETDDGPIDYHLSFYFYNYGKPGLNAGSAGWYEGDIMIGGAKKHCLLVDKNADGTFDTKSLDSEESDLIAFGQKDNRIARSVGNYVELDGTFYRPEIARDGQYMNVKLPAAEDIKFGTVRLPENITEFVAAGENGWFIAKPANSAVKLPAGKYCIDRWAMEQKDEKDNKWTLKGHSFGDSGIFDVSEGRKTVLTLGEPIITGVDQISKKGDLYSFVNPNVKGRFGECLDLGRNEDGVLAQLHIRSKDGLYDRTFTFEYG